MEGSSGEYAVPPAAEAASRRQERALKAIAASPGIAIGQAVLFSPSGAQLEKSREPASEWERYCAAVDVLRSEWEQARVVAAAEAPGILPIVDSYLRVLTDPVLQEQVQHAIAAGASAEGAVQQVLEPVIGQLRRSRDLLLQERGMELEQFLQRFLAALRYRRTDYRRMSGAVVVASALTPSEIVLLHRSGACGLVTAVGGIASHTTILARSLQLPAVIGLREALSAIAEGDPLVVDGYSGVVIVNPTPLTRRRYERHRDSVEWRRRVLRRFSQLPAQTTDGRCFRLMANITSAQDVDEALLVGAEGIGLVRTEVLLFQLGRFPTEEEQFQWYRELAERFYPQPVTFRLFDVGGEKNPDGTEPNPALGLRGVRFLLAHPELLRGQLRAILRAARTRNVRILVPMVNTGAELQQVRDMLGAVARELEVLGETPPASLPLGAMIETPAAALSADALARVADFFSIGTNDLTQYTLAVDRSHGRLAEFFDPFHPAVWHLMVRAVEAARRRSIPVGVCGELVAHAGATELLVGLGVEELSTLPAAIVPLKHRIRRLSFQQAQQRLRVFLREGVLTT
ncbi:Phosphoenolpyruvate-protein phosphotransferase [bacterium HR21]|nr:Phosphoenolpyruvate-protein phosphotransferase [bacterium HR21]